MNINTANTLQQTDSSNLGRSQIADFEAISSIGHEVAGTSVKSGARERIREPPMQFVAITTTDLPLVDGPCQPYTWRHAGNPVADLGLRLSDVEQYELVSEMVTFTGGFAADTITTTAEQTFLRSGRRVELNAFTSPEFIEWLESKLREQGLGERLIPEDAVLAAAYRRAVGVAHINRAIRGAVEEAKQLAEEMAVPTALSEQLQAAMRNRPDEVWDQVLYGLIEN